MSEPIVIREWNADEFHQRVLELEKLGYIARRAEAPFQPLSPVIWTLVGV